jgi:hypothetical protein
VTAPIKTDPIEMASRVVESVVVSVVTSPPAMLKKTKYVGALSKKLEKNPESQK